MAYTDFIAAIDLGSSKLTGVVGVKTPSGGIRVIANEEEPSGSFIRRGCVFNIEETAAKIKSLISRMERKLEGGRIAKIYVGVGGQSLHTQEYSVVKELAADARVTDEVVDLLLEECHAYKPEMLEVLYTIAPTYYLDGRLEANPVGVPCKQIEARFKLVVGRPSVRKHIETSIVEKTEKKIAGLLISPLALADAVLLDHEKDLGCALINMGAGVTSVSVYKSGKLQHMCVIPLGGALITKDLMTYPLIESEAERIKIIYGNAVADKEDATITQVNAVDGVGRDVRVAEINHIVEARAKEILENVFAQLEAMGGIEPLGAGIVLTGGASYLPNIAELIHRRLKREVRYATVRKELLDNPSHQEIDNLTAIGLLLQGDENCAVVPERKVAEPMPEPVLFQPDTVETIKPPVDKKPREDKKTEKPPKTKPSLIDKMKGLGGSFTKSLFDDENM